MVGIDWRNDIDPIPRVDVGLGGQQWSATNVDNARRIFGISPWSQQIQRVEAITLRVEAIVIRVEAIVSGLEEALLCTISWESLMNVH